MLQPMAQMSSQASEIYSKYFKNIPSKYQRILVVVISSGEATPDTLNENSIECFKISIPFNAQIMLNILFEYNKPRVSVLVETIFLNGTFLLDKFIDTSRTRSFSTNGRLFNPEWSTSQNLGPWLLKYQIFHHLWKIELNPSFIYNYSCVCNRKNQTSKRFGCMFPIRYGASSSRCNFICKLVK